MDKPIEINPFSDLDSAMPIIPPRSRLYCLEPVGVKTPHVESLTSFATRLAKAHRVTIATLYEYELDPAMRKLQAGSFEPETVHKGRRASGLIYSSKPVNGISNNARIWTTVLENLTPRQDICFLTCMPWGTAFSQHLLLRDSPAWCPECYDEWQQSNEVIYSPLSWMLRAVTVCVRHMRQLGQFCPYCKKRPHFLAYRSRAGHCSHCQGWLGTVGEAIESITTATNNTDLPYQIWAAKTVSEWVGVAQRLSSPLTRQDISQAISTCIQEFADGNVREFARLIGIYPALFYNWQSGEHIPRFDYLLKICFALRVSLTDLLTQHSNTEIFRRRLKKRTAMPRNVSKVREVLEAALKEDPPPSLLEVAERLGYKNANSLRYTSQTLCKEVTARYKLWLKANGKVLFSTKKLCDENTVIKALEKALRQECPPTVVEIASNLGYRSSHTLYRKFPDLCYLITNKRTEWFEIHSKNVRLALEKVISEEPPPSLAAVIKRAGLKNSRWVCRSFPELTSAIVARHAEWKVKCEEQVRANLQTALARNPPPSLSQVAEQHGYKILNLYQKHREVCSEISARYAAYQKRVRNERRESYKAEVRKVVINLRELGVYPSIARVSKNIEDPPTKNLGVLQKILRELKQELI